MFGVEVFTGPLAIAGLPAHPLLVHVPVVAIPTMAIFAITLAIRPTFRQRYGVALIAFGLFTTIMTFLAAASGASLAEDVAKVDLIAEHRGHGETLRLIVLGLWLTTVVRVVQSRRDGDRKDPAAFVVGLGVVVLAVLSVIWAVRTGHSGADSVWGFLT